MMLMYNVMILSLIYIPHCVIISDMLLESTESPSTGVLPYNQWLKVWLHHLTPMSSLHNIPHLTPMSSLHKIPPDACHIKTPLIKVAWLRHLQSYHH